MREKPCQTVLDRPSIQNTEYEYRIRNPCQTVLALGTVTGPLISRSWIRQARVKATLFEVGGCSYCIIGTVALGTVTGPLISRS